MGASTNRRLFLHSMRVVSVQRDDLDVGVNQRLTGKIAPLLGGPPSVSFPRSPLRSKREHVHQLPNSSLRNLLKLSHREEGNWDSSQFREYPKYVTKCTWDRGVETSSVYLTRRVITFWRVLLYTWSTSFPHAISLDAHSTMQYEDWKVLFLFPARRGGKQQRRSQSEVHRPPSNYLEKKADFLASAIQTD